MSDRRHPLGARARRSSRLASSIAALFPTPRSAQSVGLILFFPLYLITSTGLVVLVAIGGISGTGAALVFRRR